MLEIAGIKLYTSQEVCKLLGITLPTFRKYMKEKRIKGRKVGKQWLIAEENIQEFLLGEQAQEISETEVEN